MKKLLASLLVLGNTSVLAFNVELKYEFNKLNPRVQLVENSMGSYVGISKDGQQLSAIHLACSKPLIGGDKIGVVQLIKSGMRHSREIDLGERECLKMLSLFKRSILEGRSVEVITNESSTKIKKILID